MTTGIKLMNIEQTLESMVGRELSNVQKIEFSKALLKELKTESYDNSNIDSSFVANLEVKQPGIILGQSEEHNFTLGSPEENYNVVMEALNSNMAIKGGIIAAVLLLIFKVIKVMTNNPEFSDKGGGGRGSSAETTKQVERVKDQASEVIKTEEELNALVSTVANNKLVTDEDSKASKKAKQLMEFRNRQRVKRGFSDKAKELSKSILSRFWANDNKKDSTTELFYNELVTSMPAFILVKNDKDFDRLLSILTFVGSVVQDNPNIQGAVRVFAANMGFYITKLTQTNEYIPIYEKAPGVAEVRKIIESIRSISAKCDLDFDIKPNGDLPITRENLNRIAAEFKNFSDNALPLNGDMSNSGYPMYSDEDAIKELQPFLAGKASSTKIIDRYKKIALYNDSFNEAFNNLKGEDSFEELAIFETNRKHAADVARTEFAEQPEIRDAYLADFDKMSIIVNLLQVVIIGNAFKMRMTTDKGWVSVETSIKRVNEYKALMEDTIKAIHNSKEGD